MITQIKPCMCGKYPEVKRRKDRVRISHYCEIVQLTCEANGEESAVILWNDYIERQTKLDQLTLF